MVRFLKMRERIFHFVGRHEIYVMAAVRFVIAFAAFSLINSTTGYMNVLSDYPIALIFALLCSFLPAGLMVFLGAVLILLQFYALSPILCLITAMIFIILFCLYLRFSDRKGLYAVLTPVLSAFGIPYVMPVASGFFGEPYAVISAVCGEVAFFILKHVNASSALFTSSDETGGTSATITLAVTEILTDQEMYIYLAAFVIAAVAVYCVRRLPVDYAHIASAAVGIALQLIIIGGGEVYLGNIQALIRVLIGCAVSLAISFGIVLMTRSLDYSRVERVQFEDDDYYYYVKAVPKAFVKPADRQVKHIHSKHSRSRKNQKGRRTRTDAGQRQQEETLEEQVMREFGERDSS
ncbi:MAG: hypothetical protein LUG27_03445 [Clostridiales bacterium]|nr:hypothetical protein [Clostridiales bacterium]MCD8132397.1 hypothetical protein [Clostridiales bacterium]